VVAAAIVMRWRWPVAAALAAGFIVVLAFHGERPEPGLGRFEAAGLLATWPAEDVAALEVGAGPARRSFRLVPGRGWSLEGADAAVSPVLAERIATALKLLRNSAPERIFAEGELDHQRLAEFGLDAPPLTVTARSVRGASMTVHFGNANPLGLARYSRVEGRADVMLLPAFLADAWQAVADQQ
jgi:hypothetical protein